jgi:hypothetical protein
VRCGGATVALGREARRRKKKKRRRKTGVGE